MKRLILFFFYKSIKDSLSGNLETEDGFNLLLENGYYILL